MVSKWHTQTLLLEIQFWLEIFKKTLHPRLCWETAHVFRFQQTSLFTKTPQIYQLKWWVEEKKKKSQPTTLVTLLPWGQDMADKTMRDVKKMSSIPIRHCKYGKVYTSLTERVKWERQLGVAWETQVQTCLGSQFSFELALPTNTDLNAGSGPMYNTESSQTYDTGLGDGKTNKMQHAKMLAIK